MDNGNQHDNAGAGLTPPDYRRIFEALPGLCLILSTDLLIIDASDNYLEATMTQRDAIAGRHLFEVFPDNPDDPSATGTRNLRESLERVLSRKASDTMAVQKYDVRRPESEGGGFEERYWSPVNSPVFGPDGEVSFIVHRVEDVTDFVRLKTRENEQDRLTEEFRSRAARMESEIYLRSQELQEANAQLRLANEELDRGRSTLEERVRIATLDLIRTNAVLGESERQYRLLFQNNPNPMWVFDAVTLRFLDVNDAAVAHYGFSRDEFLSMTIRDIRPTEEVARLEADLAKHHLGIDTAGTWKHRKKDGTIIDVDVTSHGIEYAGKPAKVVLAHDVTERNKLEAQVLRNQRMESIGTLAGGIAHDLNNVLAPILMAIQVLRRKYALESDTRLLDTIEQSARRGAGMVKQVLAFARGVDGERSVLQLAHLTTELEKIIRETFPRAIRISVSIEPRLWAVSADATQVFQMLMNLCVNARDAMPEGGDLKLRASNTMLDEQYARMNTQAKPGPYVVCSISDNGAGIPPGIIDKIFEPFFTTKELGKGTGLGLSTVLGIVRSHGGFVNVYSEPGKGTEFKVYLPAAEVDGVNGGQRREAELSPGSGELVLVVDDELGVREITRSTLEFFGYTVVTAGDGTEALALYAQRRGEIAAVITDMMMPFMDGPTTIRALTNMDPSVRIIAMSGLMENQQYAEKLGSRTIRFLQKPFTAATLLESLAGLLKE